MEKVVLVEAYLKGKKYSEAAVDELRRLAETAGAEVADIFYAPLVNYNPATFIGRGKAGEIAAYVKENKISAVIFNEEITPAQQSNLAAVIPAKIIDRTLLILDIFAARARTRDGELQVELAQLKFLLPRLGGKGAALMQQSGGARGGIGTRGPGERKLEYDKRRLRLRISKLEREIEQVRRERAVRRARRDALPVPQVAIVGYTNAGKSTLLNTLAKTKDVYADDKLFATLDPTTRRVHLPDGGEILFTDTVGFIQKLPHNLVHAFRATLEETAEADVILHVKDASAKDLPAQDAAVRGVITEIGAQKIPAIEAFNKTDAVSRHVLQNLKNNYRGALFISALKNDGIKELLEEVERALDYKWPLRTVKIPPEKSAALSYVYSHALIKGKKRELSGAVTFKLRMTDGNFAALKKHLASL